MTTAVVSEAELRDRLVGYRFPGGTVRVEPYEAWLGHDAMRVPPDNSGFLQPAWILVAGLRGMGMTIAELIELVGARPEDGVMFGELTLAQNTPLQVATDYTVRGSIVDVTRRCGRRAGTFDVVSFDVTLRGPNDADASTASSAFIFPRPEAS